MQFQSTVFEKEDVKKLLVSLNKAGSEEQLTTERLDNALDVWYPNLEKNLNELLKALPAPEDSSKPAKVEEYSSEILEEILDLSRVNQKLLRSPETDVQEEISTIRMMLKEIISRSEFEKDSRMKKRKRKVHPKMLDELLHMSPRFEKNFTGFQIAISLFREDFPWIYDAGIDLVRTLRNTNNPEERRDAVEAFQELIEFSFEHPLMRDMYMPDKEMWMMARDLPHILRRTLDRYI